jgi:hypothetical protein
VAVHKGQGTFVARGDGLQVSDPAVPISAIAGTARTRLPMIGYMLDGFKSPFGLATAVYMPALGIITSEISRLSTYYKFQSPRRYILHGHIRFAR